VQVRHQAGSPLEAGRELYRHPQRGLHQNQEKPEEGVEAGHQEMVLHSLRQNWTATTTPTTKVF